MACASSWASAWRGACLALCLLGGARPGAAEELLALGEELPEEAELDAELGGVAYLALRPGRPAALRGRARGAWAGLSFVLAGEEGSAPRGGLRAGAGPLALLHGGLGGDWCSPLLLGSRRRGGLGAPAAPRRGWGEVRLSTRSRPPLRGSILTARRGRLSGYLATGLPARSLWQGGLALGAWRAEIQRRGRGGSLALGVGGSLRALSAQLQAGGRAGRGERRAGALWRLRAVGGRARLRAEGFVLDGPAPAAADPAEGWLAAPAGLWLHLALDGEGAGWRWLLARRLREGCGLDPGASRSETRLALTPPLLAGGLRIDLRQLENRRAELDDGRPGFPRRVETGTLDQELGLRFEGPWRIRWRQRLGAGRRARLLALTAPRRPGWPLQLRLELFSAGTGASPFEVFDGRALYRGVTSLSGRGWRLGAELRLGGPRRRLRCELDLRHEDGEPLDAKLVLETAVTLR